MNTHVCTLYVGVHRAGANPYMCAGCYPFKWTASVNAKVKAFLTMLMLRPCP